MSKMCLCAAKACRKEIRDDFSLRNSVVGIGQLYSLGGGFKYVFTFKYSLMFKPTLGSDPI